MYALFATYFPFSKSIKYIVPEITTLFDWRFEIKLTSFQKQVLFESFLYLIVFIALIEQWQILLIWVDKNSLNYHAIKLQLSLNYHGSQPLN